MEIPKYIQTLLERSEWAVTAGRLPKGCDPGYTILLHKRTPYSLAATLKKDADALKKWCDRRMLSTCPGYDLERMPKTVVHSVPKATHHHDQWAVVIIYDPVMKHLEHLVGNG